MREMAEIGCRGPEMELRKSSRKLLGHDNIYDEEFARVMDLEDPLGPFREKFCVPKLRDLPCVDHEAVGDLDREIIYMAGHSLGLKPRAADDDLKESLDAWSHLAVMSHFVGPLPAARCDLPGRRLTANLIGSSESEVVLMNGLTVNLNLLLLAFYQPQPDRHIILMEENAFSSDIYAVKGQVQLRGYDPATSVVTVKPRKGEHTLRSEDILEVISDLGEQIAVIMFPGVQFLTGQKFDMEAITRAGHEKGCIVIFDLAHAIGNVRVELSKWEVDAACWCSYKYLNSGAGGLGGIFINKKHNVRKSSQLFGWWGNRDSTRFQMRENIDLAEGAEGYRLSNPPPWTASLNLTSLKIFNETTMDALLAKQFLITGYMEALIRHYWPPGSENAVTIITPSDPDQRGNQLSLIVPADVNVVSANLASRGILVDERPPNVMRATPVPLYVTFLDVYHFVQGLRTVLTSF